MPKPKRSFNAKALKIQAKIKAANIKTKAQTARLKAKTANQAARLENRALKGGPLGYFARRRLSKLTKFDTKRKIEASKAKIYETNAKAQIETNAANKRTIARGRAGAMIASALGGSYSTGKAFDTEKEKARTRAAEIGKETLENELNAVQNIQNPSLNQGTVAGLVTGVR